MNGRFLLAFALCGLAIASAKSYTVNLFEPAKAGTTQLKAGEYKLEVVDQKAVLRSGKTESQVSVKVETAPAKYSSTSVVYGDNNGTREIREIHIGGTTTKLIVAE